MKDTTPFTNRLQKLLDYYDLSASGFAAKIGVQRSSISHVLSGRNKPSLDFVMKLLHAFKEVSIEWLIDGNGTFPRTETTPTPIPVQKINVEKDQVNIKEDISKIEPNTIISEFQTKNSTNNKIKKIILLYTDGSFEAFEN